MPRFEWDDSLNLGDPLIDRQHRTLVDLINRVDDAAQAADRDTAVMQSLTAMYLYAKEHFFDEEGLMDRLGYPEAEAHKAMHRVFVERTHALTDACLEGGCELSQLLGFLITWLRGHIAVEDAKILRFSRQNPPA